MIGICPNCGIKLKEPPFNQREMNEVIITLRYRKYKDNDLEIPSVEKTGHCLICSASLQDVKMQKSITKDS